MQDCEIIDLATWQLIHYAQKIKDQGELAAEILELLELIKE